MIEPVYVESSNIRCVGYDTPTNTLFIRFHSGESYSYAKVPEEVFATLVSAESVGQTFHKLIKGKFEFRHLDSDPFGVISGRLLK